jgi:hypothetical protein
MGKQLVSFITLFCNLQNRARTHAVLVIGLYELLGNPTTYLIEPPGPRHHFITSGCIGPQILNFEREVLICPRGTKAVLFSLAKFLLEDLLELF